MLRASVRPYHIDRKYSVVIYHSSVRFTTGPKPLPETALHTVRSCASSFNFQYPLSSPLGHSLAAYVFFLAFPSLLSFPSIFSSITCFKNQFLGKMWPIKLTFLHFAVCKILLSFLSLFITPFLTRSVQMIYSILLQHYISKISRCFCSIFRSVRYSEP